MPSLPQLCEKGDETSREKGSGVGEGRGRQDLARSWQKFPQIAAPCAAQRSAITSSLPHQLDSSHGLSVRSSS
eukprot:338747-Hanusia_phi.AAC.2